MGHKIIGNYLFLTESEYEEMSKKELLDVIKELVKHDQSLSCDLAHTNTDLDILKDVLNNEQETVKRLVSIIEDFQPKEVRDDLATCQRGEWCKACVYHQTVSIVDGNGYAVRTSDIDICMKGLACKNFVNKSEE